MSEQDDGDGFDEKRYLEAAANHEGWCIYCADYTRDDYVEPDARGYKCPECGERGVMGAEQALICGFPHEAPPAPVVHWSCAGCGIESRTEGGERTYYAPAGSRAKDMYWGHPLRDEPAPKKPPHVLVVDETKSVELYACPECYETCDGCGAMLIGGMECGDTYDPGQVFLVEGDYSGKQPLCVDCYEKIRHCSHCGVELDDDASCDGEGRGPCCAEDTAEEDDGN